MKKPCSLLVLVLLMRPLQLHRNESSLQRSQTLHSYLHDERREDTFQRLRGLSDFNNCTVRVTGYLCENIMYLSSRSVSICRLNSLYGQNDSRKGSLKSMGYFSNQMDQDFCFEAIWSLFYRRLSSLSALSKLELS